jgi:sugar/nucleoside kinase (ribokinase family)
MNKRELLLSTAAALEENHFTTRRSKVLVGLDGFVDEIIAVVDKRESADNFSRITTITQFAQRIGAAAGNSASIELVVERVKLGGNGPIMANALASFGAHTTYLGALGSPKVHPAFAELADKARVISVADPGHTKALEFDDGKIMLGTLQSLHGLTWNLLVKSVGRDKLRRMMDEAALVVMANWTMLAGMTEIWRRMQKEICPKLAKGRERFFFADLADPTRRKAEELREALEVLRGFSPTFRVVLGLNKHEAELAAAALGADNVERGAWSVERMAEFVQGKLSLDAVVVHPREFAVSASARGLARVEGPFTPKPKISTGAGDHFNAGYCLGRLLGLEEAGALQAGVGTSGFYVRTGKSPSCRELAKFLKSLNGRG